jgi:hypothetical protein
MNKMHLLQLRVHLMEIYLLNEILRIGKNIVHFLQLIMDEFYIVDNMFENRYQEQYFLNDYMR